MPSREPLRRVALKRPDLYRTAVVGGSSTATAEMSMSRLAVIIKNHTRRKQATKLSCAIALLVVLTYYGSSSLHADADNGKYDCADGSNSVDCERNRASSARSSGSRPPTEKIKVAASVAEDVNFVSGAKLLGWIPRAVLKPHKPTWTGGRVQCVTSCQLTIRNREAYFAAFSNTDGNCFCVRQPLPENVAIRTVGDASDVLIYGLHRRIMKVDDDRCGLVSLEASATRTPIALASLQGSGQRWLRHLLELTTGVMTGSVSTPKVLKENEFLGDMEPFNDGTTLVQTTHNYGRADIAKFNGTAILLLRNPYEAILAEFCRKAIAGRKITVQEPLFEKMMWKRYALDTALDWMFLARGWIDRGQRLLVIFYDNLVKDTSTELLRIANFVGAGVSDQRLRCALAHRHSPYERHLPELRITPYDYTSFSNTSEPYYRRMDGYIDTVAARLPEYAHIFESYKRSKTGSIRPEPW
ncbi:PREDICTED: uncharacterized protein LOC106821203 [Priapulus caudatus]|uniref:Uncharacterized protein LOC106821203 n=1 Tax=Priapulus caudatus TaxID=37621 RepID=A0ABM1FAC3_PRICU|nr:PREDICTED: uncharacterized protein LOC106821203 [Priapulus caudatus]